MMLVCITSIAIADDHIVIVFDTSGSMNDYMRSAKKTRIEVAQDALIGVLTKIPPTTKVGILTFSGWIYDLQPVNQVELAKAVRSTRPSGGTPLYQYIAGGATRLLKERQEQGNTGSYKLLVVTDGAATDPNLNADGFYPDRTSKPGVLKDVMNRGIIVDAIGLDIPNNHALSTEINGTYMRGDDPKSLTTAIAKSVAEVGFGTNQDASDEAFKEISELPDGFVMAALKGLTTFENQPIGEKAPPPPIKTSQIDASEVAPEVVPPPPIQVAQQTVDQSGGTGWFVLAVIGMIGVGFVALIAVGSRVR